MKKLIIALLAAPLMMAAQKEESRVLESAMFNANPERVTVFETKLAEHNKKYHANGPYAARVYNIVTGPNTGSYVWNMGPMPWADFDARPQAENGHDAHWNDQVIKNMGEKANATYWKQESELSRFPADFKLNKLLIWYVDVGRMKGQKVKELMQMVAKVHAEKLPNETYGVYSNEMGSTKEGRDMAIVWFFEKSSWMGEDNGFMEKFEEVHGEGSFKQFMTDWTENTDGMETELWVFRPDLSGTDGMVKVASVD